jgi:hypothetical protein
MGPTSSYALAGRLHLLCEEIGIQTEDALNIDRDGPRRLGVAAVYKGNWYPLGRAANRAFTTPGRYYGCLSFRRAVAI